MWLPTAEYSLYSVGLEAIQVINSHGDRAAHYIVSSSTRTECEAVGLWHGNYVAWHGWVLFSPFEGFLSFVLFYHCCGQTSLWMMNKKWPHGNSLVVTHDWFKLRCTPFRHPALYAQGHKVTWFPWGWFDPLKGINLYLSTLKHWVEMPVPS